MVTCFFPLWRMTSWKSKWSAEVWAHVKSDHETLVKGGAEAGVGQAFASDRLLEKPHGTLAIFLRLYYLLGLIECTQGDQPARCPNRVFVCISLQPFHLVVAFWWWLCFHGVKTMTTDTTGKNDDNDDRFASPALPNPFHSQPQAPYSNGKLACDGVF